VDPVRITPGAAAFPEQVGIVVRLVAGEIAGISIPRETTIPSVAIGPATTTSATEPTSVTERISTMFTSTISITTDSTTTGTITTTTTGIMAIGLDMAAGGDGGAGAGDIPGEPRRSGG
jgi:hypothetical protein